MTIKLKSIVLGVSMLLCLGIGSASVGLAKSDMTSAKSEKAISKWSPILETQFAAKSLRLGSPVFLRITKTTSAENDIGYLEAFVQADDGTFKPFKTWEICTYSGAIGPKLKEGDGQSPEGFYFVKRSQMNPNSSYHLSFNLGFPNAFDREHNRTGSFLMVHGDCVSIGCYAMTDTGIEEIYTLVSAAFDEGQPFIRVHIFPFPMTDENIELHSDNQNIEFWRNLQEGWDFFETQNNPPNVNVSNKRYVFE